ncbi:MAG: YybH family protein [Planctomycetaceae bacterium]|jgi:uncharacterized protein (TIGR02246 family)
MVRTAIVCLLAMLAVVMAGGAKAQQPPTRTPPVAPAEAAKKALEATQKGAQPAVPNAQGATKAAQDAAARAAAAQKAAAAQAGQKTAPATKATPATKDSATKAAVDTVTKDASGTDHAADDEALLNMAVEFDKAYNARDAKSLAEMFSPDAQMIDADGTTVQGREDILKAFEDIFANEPEGLIETEVTDLRYLGPAVAIETGRTVLIPAPDQPAVVNEYTAVHMKSKEGKWLMTMARDTPTEVNDQTENLIPLSFLIGDWVDESADAVVKTTYDWSDGDKFIVGKFSVQLQGEEAFSGTQRIGWDPLARKVRSWVFDSNGGFQEGLWTNVEDQWLVNYRGVSGEGEVTSGTSVMTMLDINRWSWQSRDRIVGNEVLEDTPEVLVVRKAPPPVDALSEEEAAIEKAALEAVPAAVEQTVNAPADGTK